MVDVFKNNFLKLNSQIQKKVCPVSFFRSKETIRFNLIKEITLFLKVLKDNSINIKEIIVKHVAFVKDFQIISICLYLSLEFSKIIISFWEPNLNDQEKKAIVKKIVYLFN